MASAGYKYCSISMEFGVCCQVFHIPESSDAKWGPITPGPFKAGPVEYWDIRGNHIQDAGTNIPFISGFIVEFQGSRRHESSVR